MAFYIKETKSGLETLPYNICFVPVVSVFRGLPISGGVSVVLFLSFVGVVPAVGGPEKHSTM